MNKFLLLILSVILISCQNDNLPELNLEQKKKAENEVLEVIKAYNSAFEKKSFEGIMSTLSREVKFYGTDSAEIIQSASEFKAVIEKQWKAYDMMKYGDIQEPNIIMDNLGTFASIIYGLPCYYKEAGKNEEGYFYLRISRTLKKEKNKWVIISGIVSITNTGKVKEIEDNKLKEN